MANEAFLLQAEEQEVMSPWDNRSEASRIQFCLLMDRSSSPVLRNRDLQI